MPLVYRSKWSFTHDIYCQSVRGLEFSPDGLYLAYCSGGNLCVLDISSKRLVIVVRGRSTNKSLSSVTALTWLSKETFHLVCAFQDGIIVNITRSSNRRQLDLIGFESMIQHITCIAVDRMGSRLAVGHSSGLSILVSDSRESWTVAKQLHLPQSFQDSACETVEIVGIHWLEPRRDHLVVVYRSHGAHVWDLSSGTIITSILTTSSTIGCSSLSPDCKTLAVARQNGYDIHHLQTQLPPVSIAHGLSIPGPVLLVHGGVTLLGAARKGEICLWGSADGERLQVMKQSSLDHWRHLAAHDLNQCLLATATRRKIVLWEAIEEDSIIKYVSHRSARVNERLGGGGWFLLFLLSVVFAIFLDLLPELKSKG